MLRVWIRYGLSVALLFLLGACQWVDSSRTNILILALEGLDFESVTCLGEEENRLPGLSQLCAESVRFTHAYTPSVMSQAALASLLSARHPSEHGVRHNGSHFLREEVMTVQEEAVRRSYRTAFFSGGAPIFRKSGLSQGFEVFEDHVALALGRYYRPARENVQSFLRWQQHEVGPDSFLSVLYLNDLFFYKVPTKNEAGLERSLTRESQLRAIDASLSQLFDSLKARGIWNRTHVFLVGLNGQSRPHRVGELPGINLHSENSQVTLLIKPARKNRDQGLEWSIDANVSLVDVGATLFNLVGASDYSYLDRTIEVASLTTVLERPKVAWNKARPILTESAWAWWRNVGGYRYAIRKDHWLYFFGDSPMAFNTLVDRNEISPLSNWGGEQKSDYVKYAELLENQNQEPWSGLSEELVSKLRIGQRWAENGDLSAEEELAAHALLRSQPWDKEVSHWLADVYIRRQDWGSLTDLSKNHLDGIWYYISKLLNGEEEVEVSDPCILMLKAQRLSESGDSVCPHPLLQNFISWVQDVGTENEYKMTTHFVRQYYFSSIDGAIAKINLMNGLPWDTRLLEDHEVSLMNLVLRMPQFKKFKVIVEKSVEHLATRTEIEFQN